MAELEAGGDRSCSTPANLTGRVISGVIAARRLPQRVVGGPDLDPYADSIPSYVDSGLVYWHLMHVWLQFEGLGSVYLKLTTEEIELVVEEPDPNSDAFFMREEGSWVPATRVGALHAPAPLAALVGATVTEITPLHYASPPRPRRWWRAREVEDDVETEDYVETGLCRAGPELPRQRKKAMARKDLERILAEDSSDEGVREQLAELTA